MLLSQTIAQAEKLLTNIEKENEFFLFGALGNLYRTSLQSKKAIPLFNHCLETANEEKNQRKEVVSLIRLGEALKYDGRHREACTKFEITRKLCEKNEIIEYLDFVYQHMGKCQMELGQFEAAEEYFLEALELRK